MLRIDRFLNSITMYKLVLHGLLCMIVYAFLASLFGLLAFSAFDLLVSFLIVSGVSLAANELFGRLFKAPINSESALITAFILFFILIPSGSAEDGIVAALAALVAVASKFLFAFNKRHIFNPAALGVFVMGILGSGNALWWVGSFAMLPAALLLGFLVVRKIRKFTLLFVFIAASVATAAAVGLVSMNQEGILSILTQSFLSWPLIFLGTIMLTEPFTLPPRKHTQLVYAAMVGAISGMPFAFGPIFSTPELALLIGNVFSYIVSFKRRLMLNLVSRREISKDTFEFSFRPDYAFSFIPGQFFEWTLPHENPDARGVRRYFTISSSPSEPEVKLGVKMSEVSSSFKAALNNMKPGESIAAGQLAGDFVLPQNKDLPLVFVAGGIGVTPFRSIIKDLVLRNEKRNITLFYTVKAQDEIAYQEIFEEAKPLGIKVHYVITDVQSAPGDWKGKRGFITKEMLEEEVQDFRAARFYLSGPNAMVESYKKLLKASSVKGSNLVTDYFPGF